MKTKRLKFLTFTAASLFLAFSACEKPNPDQQSAEDDARGSYIMSDAFAVSTNEAGGSGKSSLPECVEVYRNQGDTIALTFTNCDFRGHLRNGTIIINYTRNLTIGERAVSSIVTFENYTIDGIAVEGKITTTFGGTILTPSIHVVAEDMKATFTDQRTITWDSDLTYKITSGFADGDITTNVYEMSGTASGINRKGVAYSSVYDKVITKGSCEGGYPVSGSVTIESENGTTVIDYGEGECDNIITVTNNGLSVTVTLN